MLPRTLISTFLTLLLSTTTTQVHARQPPTSFCKCICFQNSTIIPLNAPQQSQKPAPPPSSSSSFSSTSNTLSSPSSPSSTSTFIRKKREEDEDGHDSTVHHRLTCNDCTRAFCLDYNLPICKGAKGEDVFTTCFQRDSVKDETIVLLFVIITTGLLGWAVVKPWVDKLRDTETVQRYAPIGNLNLNLNRNRSGMGRRGEGEGGGLPAYRDSGGDGRRPGTRDSAGGVSVARQGGLNS